MHWIVAVGALEGHDPMPPPSVAIALLASVSLPLFVLLLSHGRWRIARPMARFVVATGCAALFMAAALRFRAATGWEELAAALVLFAGSILAGFTFWTLVAWGFTLTMLRVIAEQGGFESTEAWCRAHTGGGGIERFAIDRCGLLVRAGLARRDLDGFAPTMLGKIVAPLVGSARRFFGLSRS